MRQGNWKTGVLLWGCLLVLLAGCNTVQTVTEFTVEEDFQVYVEADRFSYNMRMPKVAAAVQEGELINQQIQAYDSRSLDDWLQLAEPADTLAKEEMSATGDEVAGVEADAPGGITAEAPTVAAAPILVYVERTYLTSREEGICALTILTRWIPSAEGMEAGFGFKRDAVSFYYDENRGKAIDEEEYLALRKLTRADVFQAFQDEYGEQYLDRAYDWEQLIWYYDDHDRLNFLTDKIDEMAVSAAEFVLTVGTEPFGLNGEYEFPEAREEMFEPGFDDVTQSEAYWQTEQYEGVRITYVVDAQTGERRLYEAAVTREGHNTLRARQAASASDGEEEDDAGEPAEDDAWTEEIPNPISTYRGVGVGDRRDYVLRMYPEINAAEQAASWERDDLLSFSEGSGGRRLEFYFAEAVLVEIVLKNPLL